MEIRLPNQSGVVPKPPGSGILATGGQKTSELQSETVSGTEKQDLLPKLEKAVEALNKWLQTETTHLRFQLHEQLNEYYVEVVNDETNEVIRQVPPKKILDLAAKMQEMIGLLVDEKR